MPTCVNKVLLEHKKRTHWAVRTNTWWLLLDTWYILFGARYADTLTLFPSFWTLRLLSHSPRGAEGELNWFCWLLFIYAKSYLSYRTPTCFKLRDHSVALLPTPPSPRNPDSLLQLPDKLLEANFGSGRCLAIGIYGIFLSKH